MKHLFVAIPVLVLAAAISQFADAEPGNGEQKCGPDGSVMRFDANAHTWTRTVAPCDPVHGQSSNNDENRRDQPANGDAKCGPDGYVLRYSASDRTWQPSVARCQ
jgi:hypothetical protein